MAPRSHNDRKAQRERSLDARTSRPQTFSAQKGSMSRFGFYGSGKPGDTVEEDVGGMIRGMQLTSQSRRSKVKITLPPTPWDKEKDSGHQE